MSNDLVVLVDDEKTPIGTMERSTVHSKKTPLHLAFSCYVIDGDSIFMTRRALSKLTWPGVWTNSFCGHLKPGETAEDAIHRYSHHEIGIAVTNVQCILPNFRYLATDSNGMVENEICPVFIAKGMGEITLNSEEAVEGIWTKIDDIFTSVHLTPWAFSPWFVEHVLLLDSFYKREPDEWVNFK